LLGYITSLLKVDVFDVLPLEIVLAVGERLDLVEHDVVDVQSRCQQGQRLYKGVLIRLSPYVPHLLHHGTEGGPEEW
jgi:hypothetical protein